MRTVFNPSFLRDPRKIEPVSVLEQVRAAILDVEAAPDSRAIPNLKKLSGSGSYYRIRVGDHRIGVRINSDTVSFFRDLHRREIYRYIP